jgi:uncharacterized protein (TIGR02452 family)
VNTHTSHIPRDIAIRYGHEAVSIGESGRYLTPSKRIIDLKAEIDSAVSKTISYPPDHTMPQSVTGEFTTRIEVTNETTLSAAVRQLQHGFKSVVLNFASATSPGGGFLDGARAQEEYLARSSCLFQCLRHNPMYAFHRDHYDPLYSDYLLDSPDVPVIRADDGLLLEKPYTISIITAAAVNVKKVPINRQSEILPAMWTRILKVLSVGILHHHDTIVLGAWGCGAFGNHGHDIAALFHTALTENFRGAYRQVTFAIVDWSPDKRFIGPFENVSCHLNSAEYSDSDCNTNIDLSNNDHTGEYGAKDAYGDTWVYRSSLPMVATLVPT